LLLASSRLIAQEVVPEQEVRWVEGDELAQLAKLGVVRFNGDPNVKLSFPDLFLGDESRGKVLLVNDSALEAAVSNVTTSCGCTTAIPVEKSIAAEDSSLLLIDYVPKSAGKALVEAHFKFGEKEFHLTGVSMVKPRLTQVTSSLSFDQSGKTQIEVRKHAPTPISRLVVFPPSLLVENLVDEPEKFIATLIRDPSRTPAEFRLSPAHGTIEYPEFRYQLRYPGVVELLPRRVVSSDGVAKFYLRGDVAKIADAKEIAIEKIGEPFKLPCVVSLAGAAVSVRFEHSLEPGEYECTAKIKDVSFSLPMTVR